MAISIAMTGTAVDKQVSIAQAKDHFSEIVQQAERGTVVVVTRRGKPVVRLVAEREYQRLARRKKPIDWGTTLVDTRRWKFDRED